MKSQRAARPHVLRLMRVVSAIGAILRLFSVAFLLPVLIALLYDPYDLPVAGFSLPRNVLVFFFCFAGAYLLGTSMKIVSHDVDEEDLQEREAFLTVGVGWLVLCVVAMVPFMLSGVLTSPVDAFFEAMSGMTTTGATVIGGELESISKSVMIWRAMLQYIGGMGIIVLSVAVLARLTQGGMQLLQAEAPGPSVTRIAPRLAQTAAILWKVYLLFSAVFFVLMLVLLVRNPLVTGTDIFYDALLHTFTTMSTGGFSNHGASIAYFQDWMIEALIIVFMLLSGTNFTLHHHVLKGRWKALLKDPEWRFYMGMFWGVLGIITLVLWSSGYGLVQGFRDAAFTVASLITSTGFATADYDQWPAVTKFLILLIMVTGATAGSTSGGMKHVRILLLWKVVAREITRIRHPHAVVPIRLGGRVIQPATIMATVGFFFAFVALWVAATLVLIAIDPAFTDIVDAASASISAQSNMGPALGVVGPTKTYADLLPLSKVILSLQMWAGRLEIFTALLVFTPATWRH